MHLVLSSKPSSSHPSGAPNQAARLRAEGVAVSTTGMGELTVDLGLYGWFPNVLPSEAAEDEDEDEDARDGEDGDAGADEEES
jgi:methylated-DNA-protein-cysteine methyltransferase-like protein